MNSLTDLIDLIRKRPAMYITFNSISCLNAFIDGWYFRNPDTTIDDDFLKEFQGWIERKYKISDGHSWSSIILFYSQDEREALNNFFNLYDEWRSDRLN